MIYLDACRGLNHIGRLGENEHRTLRFQESAAVLAMYPEASVTVLHKRPGDPAAYPVAPGYVTIESGIVCWTIQSGDLATVGRGQAEVVFTSGGVIAKSLIYDTMIDRALDGAGDPPEPWESWIEDVAAEAERAEAAAEDARGWTNGTDKNGNPVPSTDKHYENNAEYHSQQAGLSAQAAEQSKNAAQAASASELMHRITSLNGTPLSSLTVEAVGIPVYVDDVTQYSAYGLTDKGWYIFARITAKGDVKVTAQTAITGDAGHIATVGADHVDLAIRFEVAAVSKSVTITWGGETETFIFKATDLAVRNLDYRTTFYVYDISPYVTWQFALTSDATFVENKKYYTLVNDEYVLAEVTAGDTVPADTYYNHSKIIFAGMVRNVTYRLNEIIDCPLEFVLPEVPNDGYGAWFEIQLQYDGSYSTTLVPTDNSVKIGTASTQTQNAGINIIDLQYTEINGVKMWTLLNTHSNLPAAT